MPLVFVHGVGNRMDGDHVEQARARDELFRRHLLAGHVRRDGGPVSIHNPYWGNLASSLAWGGASIPRRDRGCVEELGGAAGDDERLVDVAQAFVPPEGSEAAPVLATARRSLADAIDLLWAAAALSAPEESAGLAALSCLAVRLVDKDPSPSWLAQVRTDEKFVSGLHRALVALAESDEPIVETVPSGPEALGGGRAWDSLHAGARRVREASTGRLTSGAVEHFRGHMGRATALFLGDVFTYLKEREGEGDGSGADTGGTGRRWGAIGGGLAGVLLEAHAQRDDEDRLIVVAHSMGGNIVYDLLSGLLGPERLHVDVLVTVGSQVGLFEELKLFTSSRRDIPGPRATRVPKPPCVGRWINVFDRGDPLSFVADPIFDDVEDRVYRTGSVRAHSAYFLQPSFHARLAALAGRNT